MKPGDRAWSGEGDEIKCPVCGIARSISAYELFVTSEKGMNEVTTEMLCYKCNKKFLAKIEVKVFVSTQELVEE